MVSEKFVAYANSCLQKCVKLPSCSNIQNLLNCAIICMEDFNDLKNALLISQKCKDIIIKYIFNSDIYKVLEYSDYLRKNNKSNDEVDMLWRVMLFEARNMQFDSYLLYLEKNREPKDRFYFPRRKCLQKINWIQSLQDLIDDKLDLLSLSGPPGCFKTTLEKFFHSAICGWFPSDYNLFFSHSAGITRMYYDGVLSIISDNAEYTWNEIFPDLKITSTNAKMEQINIGPYKPFPNVQTASVGSEMAGKVRCSKFLLCDDIIGKIEEALNKNTLDKLWNVYSTDARQRKITGCKELLIATRWSTLDPIGRLQHIYEGNDRYRFIAVPDIDPETGKSNFEYDINPFTVEFYHDQELLMDEITYRCLYKNDPIEREGLLYDEDTLRRYLSLPDREPDAIVGVCDTKSTGKDYMVLPVFYQYDSDYYLVDCICDNSSDFGMQEERLKNIIIKHKMQQCEFESNAGGGRLALNVAEKVKNEGGRCNITTKATETNKETRIIVNSDWIKRNVLFQDKNMYGPKSDYGIFMNFLLSYSIVGKNAFDDVPDCLANFALFVTEKYRIRQSHIIRGGYL